MKIIEIDRIAQKMTDEALAMKSEAEAAVENDKKKLRESYIDRAHHRIKVIEQTEMNLYEQSLAELEKKYADVSAKLDETYQANHEKWVSELYTKVIGG